MKFGRFFLPGRDERRYLTPFYWSSLASEFLNVILPFQFVYLFLVLDDPSWAPIPLVVLGIVVFVMEIPTGLVADRWGRKISTLIGDSLSAIGWVLIPFTSITEGWLQLLIACSAFAIEGLGQTLVSGAKHAWVMDNLIAEGKEELTDQYFARERSLGSLGGIFSSCLAWMVLSYSTVDIRLINGLWYVSALGQLISVIILFRVKEYSLPQSLREHEEAQWSGLLTSRSSVMNSLKTIFHLKALSAFSVVLLIYAFSTSISEDALEISMVTKGLNPRDLAPLAIMTDLIGFIAPVIAIPLVRRFGAPHVLAMILVALALAFSVFFLKPPLSVVIAIFLALHLLQRLWEPIAEANFHSLIPSGNRATVASIVHQFVELASTMGMIIFAIMLGRHGQGMREAIPDIVEAFSGVEASEYEIPQSFFGMPVYDLAVIAFAIIGLFAAVILWTVSWGSELRKPSRNQVNDVHHVENQGV